MYFGRTFGTGLMVLGVILCIFQVVSYTAQLKRDATSTREVTKETYAVRLLPGVVGADSLVAGIALFVTARRRNETNSKCAVK